jgi:hypothetical protein
MMMMMMLVLPNLRNFLGIHYKAEAFTKMPGLRYYTLPDLVISATSVNPGTWQRILQPLQGRMHVKA